MNFWRFWIETGAAASRTRPRNYPPGGWYTSGGTRKVVMRLRFKR